MLIEQTNLPGVLILTPARFGDARGWFSESWNSTAFAANGIHTAFVQDNHSFSALANTVRGLHYQSPPDAQAKLVRCTKGAIFDVAVDVRRGSPTYGQWAGVDLTALAGRQLFIPTGFLHGFATRENDCEVQYKCSTGYARETDAGIKWDDPDIGINWGLTGPPILSAKDAAQPAFAGFVSPFDWATP